MLTVKMNLEVGMYVRTKQGIAKIVSKKDISGSLHTEHTVFILGNGNQLALNSKKVSKASHNIIDLIEVGDYVNGHLVFDIVKDYSYDLKRDITEIRIEVNNLINNYIKENEIKSIVTKEQFERMSYKIGE